MYKKVQNGSKVEAKMVQFHATKLTKNHCHKQQFEEGDMVLLSVQKERFFNGEQEYASTKEIWSLSEF